MSAKTSNNPPAAPVEAPRPVTRARRVRAVALEVLLANLDLLRDLAKR